MSGDISGVKVQMFIHCFCHLIVIADIESFIELGNHLGIVSSLYDFFKLHNIKKAYEGAALHKLITMCWSGHYFAIQTIAKNKKEIIEAREKCSTWHGINGSQHTAAVGLKHQVDDIANKTL